MSNPAGIKSKDFIKWKSRNIETLKDYYIGENLTDFHAFCFHIYNKENKSNYTNK